MNNKLLAIKLKEIRKTYGYTQEYVASALNVVRQTYSHYETGKNTPPHETIYQIAKLYNISIDDLMILTVDIDKDICYDAPLPSITTIELNDFLKYFCNPRNKKKYQYNSLLEKNLLFYFERISETDKKEIIEFTKVKARKSMKQNRGNGTYKDFNKN